MKKLLTLSLSLFPLLAFAVSFEQNGISYETNGEQTVSVIQRSNDKYSGNLDIPSEISYQGKTYRVTEIDYWAFYDCSDLWSVTIPNSVTNICEGAFFGSGLTSVIIPISVTSIGNNAFVNCGKLTSITISNSVTSIGDGWLSGCTSLKSVEIPNSITSIGDRWFNGCSSLENVEIPNSVTSIGEAAFSRCSNLTSVAIPNSVTSIGGSAFFRAGLTNIIIPNSVTSIDYSAFEQCKELTDVTISNQLSLIEGRVFLGCSSLTSITIPNSVTSISDESFRGCSSLESIEIPRNVISIESSSFADCSNLDKITVETGNPKYDSRNNCNAIIETQSNTLIRGGATTVIPTNITEIAYDAFSGCSNLTSVAIPDGVTRIGESAFRECSSLKSISIPEGITYIPSFAFCLCSSLTDVTLPNSTSTIGEQAFSYCTSLTNVNIPDGVGSIGYAAFVGCNLNSISIPESVWGISDYAFACENLTSVYAHWGTPFVFYRKREPFGENLSSCTLYVPKGTASLYSEAEIWKDFGRIEEFDPNAATDISTIDNTVYIEPITTRAGKEIVVPLNLKNTESICGFEFNLVLPEGIIIPKDEEGYYQIQLSSDRTTSRKHNIFDATLKEDGSIYVLCNSTTSKTFDGSDGEVALITMQTADTMEAGDYPIALKNIVLAKSDASTIKVAEVVSLLTIESYTPGDANGDNEINGGDITAISNYLLGYPNSAFEAKGADFNEDNEINGADITAVSNYMLYGNIKGPGNE